MCHSEYIIDAFAEQYLSKLLVFKLLIQKKILILSVGAILIFCGVGSISLTNVKNERSKKDEINIECVYGYERATQFSMNKTFFNKFLFK